MEKNDEDYFVIAYTISDEKREELFQQGMTKKKFLSKYMYFKPITKEHFKEAEKIHEKRLLSDPEYREKHSKC